MTSFDTGRRAEHVAARFLEHKGCTILNQNWRTRWCEIDIVAKRDSIIYFCEVKYRLHNRQGSGLEYITSRKLRQMRFAAEFWMATHAWEGPCELCAIEISGPDFRVSNIVKDLV